jgi:hypothetical protein
VSPTAQAVRGLSRPPCRHFKIQSCCCLIACEGGGFPNPSLFPAAGVESSRASPSVDAPAERHHGGEVVAQVRVAHHENAFVGERC